MNRTASPAPAPSPLSPPPVMGNDDVTLMPVYSVSRDEIVAGLMMRSAESHVDAARAQMGERRAGKTPQWRHQADAVANLRVAAQLLMALADLEQEWEIAEALPLAPDDAL